MTFDPNDPRLTAYALDELDDEARKNLEEELEGDSDAMDELASIAALADILRDEFTDEQENAALTEIQHQALEDAMKPTPNNVVSIDSQKKSTSKKYVWAPWLGVLAAAGLAGLVFGPMMMLGDASDSNVLVQDKVSKSDLPQEGQQALDEEKESPKEVVFALEKSPEPVSSPVSTTEMPKQLNGLKLDRNAVAANDGKNQLNLDGRDDTWAGQDRKKGTKARPSNRPSRTAGTTKDRASMEQLRQLGYVNAPEAAVKPSYMPTHAEGEKIPTVPVAGEHAEPNTEKYAAVDDNAFIPVSSQPLSTFSIDVDTAAYSNVRRFLTQNRLPPTDAVRIEEMINYFDYDYAPPKDDTPFAVHVETASSPWRPESRLVRVGIKGREIDAEQRPSSNLVFLLDVSGSMSSPNKLPLLKQALTMLVQRLNRRDHVAIVVYAGASGLVLPSTSCANKSTILNALNRLNSGGSTNGGAGIELAYKTAMKNFRPNSVNRVILATDGDFNVGVTTRGSLTEVIEEKAKTGVFLSVLGFGMGNYNDGTLERLADKGNGNYAYIDTAAEARKVLVEQLSGTLVTIAKDVKIQVEFNPAHVAAYRLIGYNNRLLAAKDFNDDTKDAGEIGAGHTVTALYEIVPAGYPVPTAGVDSLKYQQPKTLSPEADSRELLNLKLRYKKPEGDTSRLLEFPVEDRGAKLEDASPAMKFAVAVAGFGQQLRRSPHARAMDSNGIVKLARAGRGLDKHGYRAEFIELVRKAQTLKR